ncbi:MAG: hypothetical protein HY553_08270 [Elusimicrobia bacterium]|nr:hypothetical protein [Elusimicrobiota bacterium]
MAHLRGLLGGVAALALLWASVAGLSTTLHRLPWTGLVAKPAPRPPVAPVYEDVGALERSLAPGERGAAGSVPMYREARPQPRWRPAPPEADEPAPAPPPAARPAPARSAAAPPAAAPRFKLEALPSIGDAFGASAGPAGGAPAGASPAAFQPSPARSRDDGDDEAPQPAGDAWDQGTSMPAAAPRARFKRAVPQSGSVPLAQPQVAPEEEFEEE